MALFPSPRNLTLCLRSSSILATDMHTTPVPSPCTSVCSLSPATGLCLGCFRTIDEIARWGQMTHSQRQAVLLQLPSRQDTQSASQRPNDHTKKNSGEDH